MHLLGALLLAAIIGAFTFGYLGRASARVAAHGTPGARRVAQGGRRAAAGGRARVQRGAAEIWAEVRAADWLERRRASRARRAAVARGTGRGAVATARGLGWAARAAGRGGARGLRAIPRRPPAGPLPDPAAAAPAPPPPPPPQSAPPSSTNGRNPAVTTVSTGSAEKLIEGVNQVHAEAASGGIHAKHAGIKACGEGAIRFSAMLQMMARAMSEPGQNYGPEITEPLSKAGTQIQAAALSISESDSSLSTLINSTVGDLARSPRQAPHHTELSENGSR